MEKKYYIINFAFIIAAMLPVSCQVFQKPQSTSSVYVGPQNLEAALKELSGYQNKVVYHLERSMAHMKATGSSEYLFIPSLRNCRLNAKFSIHFSESTIGPRKTLEATLAVGRLTRRISFDLNQNANEQIAVFYKISDLSLDHKIPMLGPNGLTAEDPEVQLKRVLKDFGEYFRGSSPDDYIQLDSSTDAQSAYLHWLSALGHFNDYLVKLIEYRRIQSSQNVATQ